MRRLSSTDAPADAGSSADEETEAVATDEAREELLAALTAELGDAVVGSHIRPGDDLWLRVQRDAWAETGRVLRDGHGFAYFNFLSAIDWMPSPFGRDMDSQVDLTLEPEGSEGSDDAESGDAGPAEREAGYAGGDTRFQVFARVNDVVGHRAITVKADLDDDDPRVASWVPVYAGANWHEREAWEMYGITFEGHPGLRHLYLPGAFEGTPLRKDYPLLARRMKPWPGIVDVELMPDEDEPAETTGGEGA